MNLEHKIARRTNQSLEGSEPSIMMRVARLAVALSVGVMVITMAVIVGFKDEIWSRLTGLSAHAVICSVEGVDPTRKLPIEDGEPLRELIASLASVERISPYIARAGVIKSQHGVEGIVLKGVDSLFNRPFYEQNIIEGELPLFGTSQPPTREMILSASLAQELKLKVGDRVEILFSEEDGSLRRQLFKLAATYSSGMQENDHLLALADIAHLRRTNGWGEGQISGIEVWLSGGVDGSQFAAEFNYEAIYGDRELGDNIGSYSLAQLYPSLMGWLATHDVNGLVVIVIMFIVAAFNMITALLILVLERRNMILTLRSLGMNNGSLQQIFIYRAGYLLLWGLLWGNGVAIALCLAQQRWGLIKLDAEGYLLSQVPISLGGGWLLALNMGVAAMILMVMILPTRLVTKIK